MIVAVDWDSGIVDGQHIGNRHGVRRFGFPAFVVRDSDAFRYVTLSPDTCNLNAGTWSDKTKEKVESETRPASYSNQCLSPGIC